MKSNVSPPDQLQSADPRDWPVAPGWQPLVDGFFASPAGVQLLAFLRERLAAGASIFPPQPLRALELTPPETVRVVILGQDPYHGRGQAHGLAFSVAPGVALPPSLRNIFKEIERDLGQPPPAFPVPGGSLVAWAERGALLLNTTLTVEEGQPGSHAKRGWELLTDALIAHVAAQAVQSLRADAKLGIGPPIVDGFYYDFDVADPFTPDDLKALEKSMQRIVKELSLIHISESTRPY